MLLYLKTDITSLCKNIIQWLNITNCKLQFSVLGITNSVIFQVLRIVGNTEVACIKKRKWLF